MAVHRDLINDIIDKLEYIDNNGINVDNIFEFYNDNIKTKFNDFFSDVIENINKMSVQEAKGLKEQSNVHLQNPKKEDYLNSIKYLSDQIDKQNLDSTTKIMYSEMISSLEAMLNRSIFDTRDNISLIEEYLSKNSLFNFYYSLLVPYSLSEGINKCKNGNIKKIDRDFFLFNLIFSYLQLSYISKNNLDKIYIKNKNVNLNDYFMNLIIEYIDCKINKNRKEELSILINDLKPGKHINNYYSESVDYRKGIAPDMFEIVVDMNFDKFEYILTKAFTFINDNSSKNNIKKYAVMDNFLPEWLFTSTKDEGYKNYDSNYKNEFDLKDTKLNILKKCMDGNNYYNILLGNYINDLYVNKTSLTENRRISKICNLESYNLLTNDICIIEHKYFYGLIDKYLYNPSKLKKFEFETIKSLFKLILSNTPSKLRRNINLIKENKLLTRDHSDFKIDELIKAGIELNSNSVFSNKNINRINIIDVTSNSIIEPLMYKNSSYAASKIEEIDKIFNNFKYDIDVNASRFYYKDLDSYFEEKMSLGLLKDSGINIKFDLKINSVAKRLVKNISDKVSNNKNTYYETNHFIISYDGIELTHLTLPEFFRELCRYIGKFFPDEARELDKAFRNEIVNIMFR
ncbi:hypothetical protein [Staphylococcus phage vB_StaM_PB50]|nr:hypothetical protein [Staphylococcus phage vB_StaM_PB50]